MDSVKVGAELLKLGKQIGKGGEGEVYLLHGMPGCAVKIYAEKLRTERQQKICEIVRSGVASSSKMIAYPSALAHDSRGAFVGFVMQLVKGCRPIHELYTPKSRIKNFPSADYRFVIHAALNVARAIGSVHQQGNIVGDLNHSGVLISEDATVALIDADSFQFTVNGVTYPCLVGVPDFTPPELHGKDLSTTPRTLAHDHFGLAVVIFQLLFGGRHPYAGVYSGSDSTLGNAIAANRFAYSIVRRGETRTTPPPNALTLDLFPGNIRQSFEKSFGAVANERPSASAWCGVLESLATCLKRCERRENHYFFNSSTNCPWCVLGSSLGFDMFPSNTVQPRLNPGVEVDLKSIVLAIRGIKFPSVEELLARTIKVEQSGSFEAIRALENSAKASSGSGWGTAMVIGSVIGVFAFPPGFIIWLIMFFVGLNLANSKDSNSLIDRAPFEERFLRSHQLVDANLESLLTRHGVTEVFDGHQYAIKSIAEYEQNERDFRDELRRLESTRRERQLAIFLDRYSVLNAKIRGVGPVKTAALLSFGVETAADVTSTSVRLVPGFGPVMVANMLAWRKSIESRFSYHASVDAAELQLRNSCQAKLQAQKAKLIEKIRVVVTKLSTFEKQKRSIVHAISSDPGLVKSVAERSQAEHDLKVLSLPVPFTEFTYGAKQRQSGCI